MRYLERSLAVCLDNVEERPLCGGGVDGIRIHVFDVLKAIAQIANKWMIDVFEHSTLTDDISYTLGSDD
jgi:hypothetical protein